MNQKVFISVGEASGDLLAAELLRAYKDICPDLQSFGVTGKAMQAEGVETILDMKHLSVMGFLEVLKQARFLFRVEAMILAEIERRRPDVAILVDYPGLHFRLAPQIQKLGVKVVQYVAPKVWAWGEKRAHALRRDFDLVLGILPFEEEFFRGYAVPYHYVGSPHKARMDSVLPLEGIEGTCVAVLPGSRLNEWERLLGDILGVIQDLSEREAGLKFLLPVAENLSFSKCCQLVADTLDANAGKAVTVPGMEAGLVKVGPILLTSGKSLEVLRRSKAAIVASGTATLECALLQVPMIVLYKISPVSYWIAKRKVKLNYFSLVNLMLGEFVIPEFIQNYEIKQIADTLYQLLDDRSEEYLNQSNRFKDLYAELSPNAETTAVKLIQELLV